MAEHDQTTTSPHLGIVHRAHVAMHHVNTFSTPPNDLLVSLLPHMDVPEARVAILSAAAAGTLPLPLQATYHELRRFPTLAFHDIFMSDLWAAADFDIVGEMTASKDYSAYHIRYLHTLIAINPDLPRTGLASYVNGAMAYYCDVSGLPVGVAKDLLVMARKVDGYALDMDNVLMLAQQEPRAGIKLLWLLCTWSHDGLIDYADAIVGIVAGYRGASSIPDRLLLRMSWWAPGEVADAFSRRGGRAMHRAHATSRDCKWCMVDYLQIYAFIDSRPAEELMSDNLARAVHAGVFTSCCVLGDLAWPQLWDLTVDMDTPDNLVFHMATTGEVPHTALWILNSVNDEVVTALVRHNPALVDPLVRARNWIRRAAFVTDVMMYRARVRGSVRRKGERPGEAFHQIATDDQMAILQTIVSYI